MPNDMTLYSLQHLCRSFKVEQGVLEVLKDISLDFPKGKWIAVTGRSGSGKSTLLQILGTLDRPTSGKIIYNGQDITKMSAGALTELRRRDFGFVFQSYHLLPELTALENAALPALGWGNDRAETYRRARELLDQFGLAERLNHHPSELSGGEQQRVALARALIHNPPVILADEPTGNLDRASGEKVIGILRDLKEKYSKSIIMVTHDMEIAAMADMRFDISG